MAETPQVRVPKPTDEPPETKKRRVIGIYGIPGSGKTFVLRKLQQSMHNHTCRFFEGSELIDSVVPGGLQVFNKLSEQDKIHWRTRAIEQVANEDEDGYNTAIVTGHYMFWDEDVEEENCTPVITEADFQTYTHIIYLDVPPEIIAERRQQHKSKSRPMASIRHLDMWRQTEKSRLRRDCYEHGILFSVVPEGPGLAHQIFRLTAKFRCHDSTQNRIITGGELSRVLNYRWKRLVMLDADKTLTAIDTGELFWNLVEDLWPSGLVEHPLKDIFKSKMQYTHNAFAQVMLLYEEICDSDRFNELCKDIASRTCMYPEFVSFLQGIAEQDRVGAVIVTTGLRRVWEMVLERHGLFDKIKVIGGGQFDNDYVVTSRTKAQLVRCAKDTYKMYVYAFGDSPLDLDMLQDADQAIVVVGDEQTRSKSMEAALTHAIDDDDLRARQVLLPGTVSPRVSLSKLPAIQLTGSELIQDIVGAPALQDKRFGFTHAMKDNAAKLLMTPMRDASKSGPDLQQAHRRVGNYLATAILSNVCGVEEYSITHVQGHQIAGYRLLHEHRTTIVPLMRGGASMALGVNEALPNAMFLHARQPEDIRHEHVYGQLAVILVDSVVNTGESLLKFVHHIREIHATIRIVMIAGVVQSGALSRLKDEACCLLNFKMIALRISDNEYIGQGRTDTGSRLFNTQHLDL